MPSIEIMRMKVLYPRTLTYLRLQLQLRRFSHVVSPVSNA